MNKTEFIEKYGIEKYQKMRNQQKEWYKKNRNITRIFYRSEKEKRACKLIQNYRFLDKKYKRGECLLTVEQLINLFDKGCYWCGETDWHSLGADRIDNSKPHTIDNCVCSCRNCNVKRGRTKKIIQYTLDENLINEWNSAVEASKLLGVNITSIYNCCNKRQKSAGGFIWKYKQIV